MRVPTTTKPFAGYLTWRNLDRNQPRSFTCGHCGCFVASKDCYFSETEPPTRASIHICPGCSKPSVFLQDGQWPSVKPGQSVHHLPDLVELVYEEARAAAAANAHTAAVMAGRKLLMNVAVELGDVEGKRFIEYINYLDEKHYIPPGGRKWVTAIKDLGNEASHEIRPMSAADSTLIIAFVAALLRHNYELPGLLEQRGEAGSDS